MEIRSARSLFLSVQHKGESLSTQMESGEAGGLIPFIAAISSNTATTRRPPKLNLMGTERQDSITV